MSKFEGLPNPDDSTGDSIDLEAYEPSEQQRRQLDSFKEIMEKCENEDVHVIVAGGYGLDGLYGKLTRDHDDIDLAVPDESLGKMDGILVGAGYEHHATQGAKKVYANPALAGFKVEYGPASGLDNFSEEGKDLFIPDHLNASLEGRPFRAITLRGVKEVIRFQNTRAEQESWKPYPDSKRQNQMKIISELEKRESP